MFKDLIRLMFSSASLQEAIMLDSQPSLYNLPYFTNANLPNFSFYLLGYFFLMCTTCRIRF